MVLVDHQIKSRVEQENLIDSYDKSCLTNIGYDLRTKRFYNSIDEKEGSTSVTLQPNESVFVESVEKITMPTDLMARIALKNGRMRLGLSLDAPIYQPGHETRIYFRLTNVSASEIALREDEKYAMIVFEKLDGMPDCPYNGIFQDEFDFRGLGEYKNQYNRQLRALEEKTDDIKAMEGTIYSNVLTILSVFVALFSFVTINVQLVANSATMKYFGTLNALLLGCISFLVALLNMFLKPKKMRRWQYIVPWIPAAVAFAAALILYSVL